MLLALAAPSCLAVPVADPVADASADAYASDYSHYIPAPSSQYHAQVWFILWFVRKLYTVSQKIIHVTS